MNLGPMIQINRTTIPERELDDMHKEVLHKELKKGIIGLLKGVKVNE